MRAWTPFHRSILRGKRVLIFIVAYNAETTIEKVLSRIPPRFTSTDVEVLIIDDSSQRRHISERACAISRRHSAFKITVLRTPENQGYGGNQKLGYRYAIDNGFDLVALVHGDGQYAPEKLPALLAPLVADEADAVFGSRMIDKRAARAGGMPLYKWFGNQILTTFPKPDARARASPSFTPAIASIRPRRWRRFRSRKTRTISISTPRSSFSSSCKKLRIAELPIPTYYGDEICHVNGMKYAWDVFKTMLRARLHRMNLLFDRKFDVHPPEETYDLKLGFASSHTAAIARRVRAATCSISVAARAMSRASWRPKDAMSPAWIGTFRQSLVRAWQPGVHSLESRSQRISRQRLRIRSDTHARHHRASQGAGKFMDELRFAAVCKRPEIIITTANIGFFVTRLMLLFGQFNYGRKGILDATHTRLFTFRSLEALLEQSGYKILEVRGIPAPFPKAIGENFVSRLSARLNQVLIRVSKGLFSYQIFVRAEAKPTVHNLLRETIESSTVLRGSVIEAAA